MPLIDALDRLVERRVLEDDVRGLAAELEREPLAACPAIARRITLPTSVEPVNAILSTSVLDERGAGLARPGDDVHDAGRQLGLLRSSRRAAAP